MSPDWARAISAASVMPNGPVSPYLGNLASRGTVTTAVEVTARAWIPPDRMPLSAEQKVAGQTRDPAGGRLLIPPITRDVAERSRGGWAQAGRGCAVRGGTGGEGGIRTLEPPQGG